MKELHDRLEPAAEDERPPRGRRLAGLSLGALGIVYGDIGTSPLYALRESFRGEGLMATDDAVLGVLSLVFWSLVIVISLKYLLYVMRADNAGEGGILAMMSLVHPTDGGGRDRARGGPRWRLVALGLFGAALLYGDGSITPAISVLSAVEGLEVATSAFQPYVVPITVAILVLLFVFQRRGTATVGAVFGPVMALWFTVLAALGVSGIVHHPEVLAAVNPVWAARFLAEHGWTGVLVLGSVFLVVTGGEALYADLGHFGRRPIRLAWFGFVLPALLANYFGQGALLLGGTGRVGNPFYELAPGWALYPLVVLSTAATVIASQAVISGAFSLTRQAIQLGYCPRMRIEHTSEEEIGQIYMPTVNWTLMVATIALVLGFQRSGALAAAYGVAVSTTMVITTVLAFVIARERWGWGRLLAGAVTAALLVPDLAFFTANMTKIADGGWYPLLVGGAIFLLLSTWYEGRQAIERRQGETRQPLDELLRRLEAEPPRRVEGASVFLVSGPERIPAALLYQLEFNQSLTETVILLIVRTRNVPRVSARERVECVPLGQGLHRVVVQNGFVQPTRLPGLLRRCRDQGLALDPAAATWFVARETVVPTEKAPFSRWRARLFALMSRNAQRPTAFFGLPHRRVLELGVDIEL